MRSRPVVVLGSTMLLAALALSGCATPPAIKPPAVSVLGVQVDEVGVDRQTLRMEFSVSNPNPFPLPVKSIRYEFLVGDRKLARGDTHDAFVVAARGDGAFVLNLELNVLDAVSRMGFLFLKQQVEYELHGSLAIDMPFVRPIPFSSSGQVRLRAGSGGY